MENHLLIIDDDDRIRELLKKYLLQHNFFIHTADNTAKARILMQKYIFDLIIVDNMMPDENGVEFLAKLRKDNNYIPAIMLTALSEVEDKIKGLSVGADDYISKPFNPEELILRINNIIKRTKNNKSILDIEKFVFDEFVFDFKKNELKKNNILINLTQMEMEILKVFISKINIILTREELCSLLNNEINERSIDVQITRLRKKIEENESTTPKFLKTIRNKGYIFSV